MKLKTILLSAAMAAAAATTSASAATFVFVGQWDVNDGPTWSARDNTGAFTTPSLSGQMAAALIFGGDAIDYAISTVSNQVSDINFSAWMDCWGDAATYGSTTPAAHDLLIDTNGDGLYADPGGLLSACSAYVSDHAVNKTNYAFRVTDVDIDGAVPVPAALPLFASVLLGGAVMRRRKKT